MSGSRPNERIRGGFSLAAAIVFAPLIWCGSALAQEPPLDVPGGGRLAGVPPEAIAAGGWAFYPTLKISTVYSDNWFQSPTSPISAFGVGINPGLTAEWTNGIHKLTIYTNLEHRDFPAEAEINTLDYQAGMTERYEMLRDLVFRFQGDFTHKTISGSLNSSTPASGVSSQSSTVLPNGNTLLPNGSIVTPTGQFAGSANPGLTVNGRAVVNPYDQFTGTASVDKYFNRGIVSVTTTFTRLNYQNSSSVLPSYSTPALSGNGAFWLTPVFYLFSNGNVAENLSPLGDITTNRAEAGIGFRESSLIGGSVYFGHQGSSSAGGDVFGGSLSYNPTADLSFRAVVDGTINQTSSSSSGQSALSQSLPQQVPLVVSLSDSTRIVSTSLTADYIINMQWHATTQLGYTRVDYIGATQRNNVWLADAMLSYDILRDLTLTWEYQYTSLDSNAALTSSRRNYAIMSALYKF